jgi:hypothetical protein
MRPSSRLFLDPDVIYSDRRARQRARWLFNYVSDEVRSSPECKETRHDAESGKEPGQFAKTKRQKNPPFPPIWRRSREGDEDPKADPRLRSVGEVADSYPRLLAWLTEGKVSKYWNVFGLLIAVLRLIPGVRWIIWRTLFEPIACRAPWRLALYEVILEDKRYTFNKRSGAGRFSAKLAMSDCTPGLSAVTDATVITSTAARNDLRSKIEKMSSGCIGVSGLRGSGKTSLLHDFCRHRYGTPPWSPADVTQLPGLRLTVQAPLRFDAREFLIYLYTCLCKAVLADIRLNPTSFVDRIVLSILVPPSVRPATLLRGAIGIALFAFAGSLAYRATAGTWPFLSWQPGTWEWLGMCAALLVAIIVVSSRTRQALIELRQVRTLATDAQARLERLHFQRTDTRSRGGALGGPMGTGLNLSSTQGFTEQVMTLPELIDDYRDFAERVVAALQQAASANEDKDHPAEAGNENIDVRLVIGIDEMDRIEDAESAGKFLAELSSVFGTSHSVYLISVSPEALAAGGRRMVPLKTASSGIFDDMVWVEPLDLPTAGDLLDRRVIGLPASFIALCYVLSGGLPRDLLRIARTIFSVKSGASKELGLAEVTENVIQDELTGLKNRAMAEAISLEIPASPDLLRLLNAEDLPIGYTENSGHSPRPVDIKTIMDDLSKLWAGKERQRFRDAYKDAAVSTAEICDSFLAGLYFLMTIEQLFTTEPNLVTKLAACRTDGTFRLNDDAVLRDLARARTTLAVSPYLAAKIIQDARHTLSNRIDHSCPLADVEPDFLNPPPPITPRGQANHLDTPTAIAAPKNQPPNSD